MTGSPQKMSPNSDGTPTFVTFLCASVCSPCSLSKQKHLLDSEGDFPAVVLICDCVHVNSLSEWLVIAAHLSFWQGFSRCRIAATIKPFFKEGWALATRGHMVSEAECTKTSCICIYLTRKVTAILRHKRGGNWRVREVWTGIFTALKPCSLPSPTFLRKAGPWNAHCDEQWTSGRGIHKHLANVTKLTHTHEKP